MKLTNDSKHLLLFVKNIKLSKNTLNSNSKEFLSTLINKINYYDYNDWYNKLKQYVPPQERQSFDGVIPQNIINDITIKYNNVYSFHLSIGKRNFFINMYFKNDQAKEECIGYCHKCIYKIYLWLSIANFYAKNDFSNTLKIYIYFTDHKKILPDKDTILNTSHVNSAYTYACKKDTMISIFRKEEWFKVFIHETFHCMGLDFACMDTSHIDSDIFELFPLKKYDIRAYEAYTENWAEILNVLFIVYFSTQNKNNTSLMLSKAETMLNNERKFSLYQLNKVLKHNNLDYDTIFCNKESSIIKKQNYRENTYVISYYLLKSILIFNINDFLNWNKTHNKTIAFNNTHENLKHFSNFIKEKYKNPNYINFMKDIQKLPINNNTMRMSLYEI